MISTSLLISQLDIEADNQQKTLSKEIFRGVWLSITLLFAYEVDMRVKGYNYLIGKAEKLDVPFDIDKRIDPDTCGCKELYDDFIEAFFSDERCNVEHGIKKVENVKQQFGNKSPFYTIFLNDSDYLMSTDYIGPSVYWARYRKISDSNIIKFLSICRTIGGHMAWPRGRDVFVKINGARAGKDGLYDRIDWTLALIKIYYETLKEGKKEFIAKALTIDSENLNKDVSVNQRFERMYDAFNCSKSWFELFESFSGFCRQFKMIGKNGFVSNDYEVIKMAPWFPFLPENYANYIDNICDAIITRNNEIYNS